MITIERDAITIVKERTIAELCKEFNLYLFNPSEISAIDNVIIIDNRKHNSNWNLTIVCKDTEETAKVFDKIMQEVCREENYHSNHVACSLY